MQDADPNKTAYCTPFSSLNHGFNTFVSSNETEHVLNQLKNVIISNLFITVDRFFVT